MALQVTGCGNRCKDVQHAKAALARQGAPHRGADVRVTVPYDQANRVIAGLLAQEPVTMEQARVRAPAHYPRERAVFFGRAAAFFGAFRARYSSSSISKPVLTTFFCLLRAAATSAISQIICS